MLPEESDDGSRQTNRGLSPADRGETLTLLPSSQFYATRPGNHGRNIEHWDMSHNANADTWHAREKSFRTLSGFYPVSAPPLWLIQWCRSLVFRFRNSAARRNCAARGNPVPVRIEGHTAPALPKSLVLRSPLGKRDTPAIARPTCR